VSFTSMRMVLCPGVKYWCVAVLTVVYAVSQVPSASQSHRTWRAAAGSSASEQPDASKEKGVAATAVAGLTVKPARGGVPAEAPTVTVVEAVELRPPVSMTSSDTTLAPDDA